MQMQPYSRGESRPALPDARGPLAERHGPFGRNGHGNGSASGNGYHPGAATADPPAPPAHAPSYLDVLLKQIKKRWVLLAVWMALTAGAAYAVVHTYGKPLWRAEGSLYYSPNFSYSYKRLYTPPNIQTVLAIIKSPEVLEKLRKEKGIGESVESLQGRLTATVQRQSDMITLSFDWPDKAQGAEYANRILELAIEQFDQLRHRLSGQALTDLEEDLKRTITDELAMRNKLNDTLGKKNIFDLKVEKDNVIREIAQLELQIEHARSEQTSLEAQLREMDFRVKKLLGETKADGEALSEADINLLRSIKETRERQLVRQRDIEQAKIKLKALDEEYKRTLPLYERGYVTKQDWAKLTSEIDLMKHTITGSKEVQEMEAKIKSDEKTLLESKRGTATIPLQQARFDRLKIEVAHDVMPKKIADLETSLGERRKRQQFLQKVEKDAMPVQQEIDALQMRRTTLTVTKQEHEKLEGNKLAELTVYSPAAAGGTPVSTNHMKLAVAVFGLSGLLFVGFVVVRDMPRALAEAAPKPGPEPRRDLPVPLPTRHAPPPPNYGRGRSPSAEPTNEHLRALAGRIAQSVSDNGAIVLFAPATSGLRIDSLVGDLGCFYAQTGGRVLIFDARTAAEGASLPAWAGPGAAEVEQHVEGFIEGHSELSAACFGPTLIASIDYSRCDLSRFLSGVMAMYRFRRLVHEMKERYTLVLMITPQCYRVGGEGDFYSTMAEGIVVVLGESTDPAQVEEYLQNLRDSETPVYGAVTVPGA
jgi:uncharacterized protein involved in exopolysaccharide biosynthesis